MKSLDEARTLLDEIIKTLEGTSATPLWKRTDVISKARMVLVDVSQNTMAIRTMVAISLGLNMALFVTLMIHIFA